MKIINFLLYAKQFNKDQIFYLYILISPTLKLDCKKEIHHCKIILILVKSISYIYTKLVAI